MDSGDVFRFGEFRLETSERRLTQDGKVVRLSPKAHDVLVVLLRHAGRLVTKDALLSQVWPDAVVEEGILTVHISALRKALGDDKRSSGCIETVSRSGIASSCRSAANRATTTRSDCVRSRDRWSCTELVGRGRARVLSGSSFEVADAVSSFRAAIELDPTYAAAHAGLAVARCLQGSIRAVPYRRGLRRGEVVGTARAGDGQRVRGCADGARSRASRRRVGWAAAERGLRRALEINPSHIEALLAYGSLMEALGRPEEGLRFKEQALARNPECTWLAGDCLRSVHVGPDHHRSPRAVALPLEHDRARKAPRTSGQISGH